MGSPGSTSGDIQVSEVRIIPIRSSDGLVAFASCIINRMLRLDNIGIVSKADGSYRLSYPTKKLSNGQNYYYFYPISREVGDAIQKSITEKFEELIKERINYGDYEE
ncbi:SpoVG family protein [Candidatus Woesebacteria bacterium]|nr:MAG: SpoVG family protein [Candidatus Woesebacteria bacterium]